MAVTQRGRRTRYDNIATGSATGPERTIAGQTVSPVEMYGGGSRTSTSTGEAWHTNIASQTSVSDSPSANVVGGESPEHVMAKATTETVERLTA